MDDDPGSHGARTATFSLDHDHSARPFQFHAPKSPHLGGILGAEVGHSERIFGSVQLPEYAPQHLLKLDRRESAHEYGQLQRLAIREHKLVDLSPTLGIANIIANKI